MVNLAILLICYCFAESTTKPPLTEIVVQIQSKKIILPDNKATLTAFAIPEPDPKFNYNYEWSLISDQKTGAMENAHNQTISLSSLEEGVYQFKVIVSGGQPPGVTGTGFGNVTVLPRKIMFYL